MGNLGKRPQKFRHPCRSLKNIGFKGRQNISLPGALTYLGPALRNLATNAVNMIASDRKGVEWEHRRFNPIKFAAWRRLYL
jgi:hypothetical protein